MGKLGLAVLPFLLVTAAEAQLVVANDQSGTATIWSIDVGTGVATPIFSGTGTNAKAWGMAYDAATNTLYWNNGSTLFSSPFGNPLVPVSLGTMTFNGSGVNFVALGFSGGFLYGTRNIATEAVYRIDPATRVATQVWIHPSTFDFGGLEFDAATGLLYGLSDTAPAGGVRGLYEIDYVGTSTTFRAPYPAGETDIDGLAVHAGVAYYVTDGPNTTQANFYVFDIATGTQTGTIPSPFTGSGTFSAATFVPPAGQACTLTCPANATVPNDAGLCSAVVAYPAPTTEGDCGPVVCAPVSGNSFPVGTTTVTCTEATTSCTFDVTVQDVEPPALVCPADLFFELPPGSQSQVVDYVEPTPTDNCPGVASACAPPSGDVFLAGTTTVQCTATDAGGLTGACTFDVVLGNQAIQEIPTLGPAALAGLAVLLAAGGVVALRRRRD